MKVELEVLFEKFNAAGSAQRMMMGGEIADTVFLAVLDLFRRVELLEARNAKGK